MSTKNPLDFTQGDYFYETKTPGCARGSKELKRCIEKTTPFDVR